MKRTFALTREQVEHAIAGWSDQALLSHCCPIAQCLMDDGFLPRMKPNEYTPEGYGVACTLVERGAEQWQTDNRAIAITCLAHGQWSALLDWPASAFPYTFTLRKLGDSQ